MAAKRQQVVARSYGYGGQVAGWMVAVGRGQPRGVYQFEE